MSKDIQLFINEELYPAVYRRAPEIFPEFGFREKKNGTGYESTTDAKVTGESGKKGKVAYLERSPFCLVDRTRETVEILKYIQDRDNLDFIGALRLLADAAGVQIPEKEYKAEQVERFEIERRRGSLLDCLTSFFHSALTDKQSEYYSRIESTKVREYLKERGYTPKDYTDPSPFQPGYSVTLSEVQKHIKAHGFTSKELEALGLPRLDKYPLAIPYISCGRVVGLTFRAITDQTPKYLNSRGNWKRENLLNLSRRTQGITLVEGVLDSYTALARGVGDVVSVSGTSITEAQLRQAERAGVKDYTLCFDNDRAGKEATERAIKQIYNQQPEARVFVVSLLDDCKDPDDYIKKHGAQSFEGLIAEAQGAHIYTLNSIIDKYHEKGDLTAKEKAQLLEEIEATLSEIPNPYNRGEFITAAMGVENISEFGVTPEALEELANERRYKREDARRAREMGDLIENRVKGYISRGEGLKGLEILTEGLKKISHQTGRELVEDYTLEDKLREYKDKPKPLQTGIRRLDDIAHIRPGAITIIGARPGEGKSTLMFNLCLNMAEKYPDDRFLYFSFEEETVYILLKLLGILSGTDLSKYYSRYNVKTDFDLLGTYIREGHTDIPEIENGREILAAYIDTGRIKVEDRFTTVEQVAEVVRHLHAKNPVRAVYLDYLQKIGTTKKTQDKRTEVGHISNEVLKLAKETKLAIIAGSQFNREGNSLSNLKESGDLEQDANLVIGIEKEKDEEKKDKSAAGLYNLEVKILKSRDGKSGDYTVLDWHMNSRKIS